MTNLDSILKSRGTSLPAKFHVVKAMAFPVFMYGCDCWTTKNSECWRIDTFALWCWRRLLRVPCMARRSNHPILKEIYSEYSLEGLMLKLQYFGHFMQRPTHWKRPWGWERLRTRGEGGDRGWDGWMASLTQWTWVWANPRDSEGQGTLVCSVQGFAKSRTGLSEWTTKFWIQCSLPFKI